MPTLRVQLNKICKENCPHEGSKRAWRGRIQTFCKKQDKFVELKDCISAKSWWGGDDE